MKTILFRGLIIVALCIALMVSACSSPNLSLAADAAARAAAATVIIVDQQNGPYKTIHDGLAVATPGQTVQVRAGVYSEAISFPKSGTAAAPIMLVGEPGAIIDGSSGVSAEVLVTISGKSYVRLIGFEIRNRKKDGSGAVPMGVLVTGACTGVEVRNNLVWGIENNNANGNAHGIAVYGDSTTAISGLVIDGNEIRDCKLGWSESMVLNGNVDGFTVSNNLVHDNNNIGIDFIGFEGTCSKASLDQTRNGICVGNRVFNISSLTNPAYDGEQSADGIYVDGGKFIVIDRNQVDNCDVGIELASEHKNKATDNITVSNNFVSRSYQGNLQIGGYASNKGKATNLTIINNTTYQAGMGELVVQYNTTTVTITNNIFVGKSGQPYLNQVGTKNTALTISNNLYWGGSNSSSGSWQDTNPIFGDPKLVGPPTNLHLQANSPAKDKGIAVTAGAFDIDGQSRVSGSAIDLGADEI